MKNTIVVCLLVAAAASPARAQFANTACAPPLQPVPFFGPPDWWSNLSGAGNELINDPFDPRWSGAAKQDFAFGANPHVTLRMGASSDATGPGIDLQFTMWVDPSKGQASFEGVWLALGDAGTFDPATTNAGLLHLVLSQTQSPTTASPQTLGATSYFYKLANTTAWVSHAAPAWATAKARQWLPSTAAAAPYAWVISVRIPTSATGSFDNPDGGLKLGAALTMAYELDAGDGSTPTASEIPYDWPRQGSVVPDGSGNPGSWPALWGTVNNGTSACAQVISISAGDLSTDYPGDDHAFYRDQNTTLHAKPHSTMTTDASITATFRVADWGSQLGVFTPGDTPWLQIGQATGTVTAGTQGDLSFVWAPDAAYWTAKDGSGNFLHLAHQCMYVELRSSTTNALLSPDSAWTNMHFGPASVFKEDARISIKGLASTVANVNRDVYLYFEKMNMNALSPPRALPPPVTVTPPPDNGRNEHVPAPREPVTVKPSVPLTQLELDNFTTPSYRVHVYYDTGASFKTPDGKRHKILAAQGDYGWFIKHAGANERTLWTAESALNPDPGQRSPGASTTIDKIRPDWWRLSLDPAGFVTMTTTITARDHPRHGRLPWWVLLLLLAIAVLVLLLRRGP